VVGLGFAPASADRDRLKFVLWHNVVVLDKSKNKSDVRHLMLDSPRSNPLVVFKERFEELRRLTHKNTSKSWMPSYHRESTSAWQFGGAFYSDQLLALIVRQRLGEPIRQGEYQALVARAQDAAFVGANGAAAKIWSCMIVNLFDRRQALVNLQTILTTSSGAYLDRRVRLVCLERGMREAPDYCGAVLKKIDGLSDKLIDVFYLLRKDYRRASAVFAKLKEDYIDGDSNDWTDKIESDRVDGSQRRLLEHQFLGLLGELALHKLRLPEGRPSDATPVPVFLEFTTIR
jgi:hypothetical protein